MIFFSQKIFLCAKMIFSAKKYFLCNKDKNFFSQRFLNDPEFRARSTGSNRSDNRSDGYGFCHWDNIFSYNSSKDGWAPGSIGKYAGGYSGFFRCPSLLVKLRRSFGTASTSISLKFHSKLLPRKTNP